MRSRHLDIFCISRRRTNAIRPALYQADAYTVKRIKTEGRETKREEVLSTDKVDLEEAIDAGRIRMAQDVDFLSRGIILKNLISE